MENNDLYTFGQIDLYVSFGYDYNEYIKSIINSYPVQSLQLIYDHSVHSSHYSRNIFQQLPKTFASKLYITGDNLKSFKNDGISQEELNQSILEIFKYITDYHKILIIYTVNSDGIPLAVKLACECLNINCKTLIIGDPFNNPSYSNIAEKSFDEYLNILKNNNYFS